MADDYRKSGQSFHGVSKDQYESEMHTQKQLDMAAELVKRQKELTDEKKKGTIIDDIFNGNLAERLSGAAKLKQFDEGSRDLRKGDLKHSRLIGKFAGKFGQQIKNQLPFVSEMNDSYKSIKKNYGFLGRFAGPVAAFAVLAKLAYDFAKGIADTRKELGISITSAAKLNAQNKLIYFQAKAYMITQEEINSAQASIRENLGASVSEAASLSLNFARTAAATGQTADGLADSLSIMESISSASRDVLLNQIRSNAAMIEAAGVAPSLVFKDIAENTKYFAEFAKDGGQNLIEAGTAARKLGLDMSAVSSMSESLLNFETSIENQMQASMLLGRQINLDKARQLALTGDHVGMMEEVLRQVGGEAEFAKMNVLQRRALSDLVGGDVEVLSRMTRNNQAAASGQITRADGKTNMEKLQSVSNNFLESMDSSLRTIKREI